MATARCCSYACSSALASSSRRPFSTTPFPTSAFHRPTAKAAAAAKATATSPIQPTPLSAVRTARLAAAAAAAAAAGTSDVARATGSEDADGLSPSELVGPRLIFDQPRHITYPQNQVQSTRMSLANDQGSVLRRTSLKGAFSNATFRVSVARKEFLPPKGSAPEIIFAGRSNVGKSSLINALVCSDSLVKTSSKAGHTKMLNFFDVGGRMVLVDAPGYGDRGRPEWGALFSYYVTQHPPSPPSLLVVLYPLDHKLLPSDQIFLASLPSHLHVLPVFTKSDVVDPRQINAKRSTLDRAIQAARESAWTEEDELGAKGRLLPSVCVSTQRKFPLRDETLENLREVILDHLTSTASSHAPAPRSREPVAEAPTRAQTPRQGGRKAPAPTARSKKTPNMKRR